MKLIELVKIIDCDYNNTGAWCEYFKILSDNLKLSLNFFENDINDLKELGFVINIVDTRYLHFD